MSAARDRVVITGMALNTPLGDQVEPVLAALCAGQSGIGPWVAFPSPPAGAQVGGDLSGYDVAGRVRALASRLPRELHRRLDRLIRRAPWGVQLSLLVAADAACEAGFWAAPPDADQVAVIVAGHNLGPRYGWSNWQTFQREPDYIDALLAVHMLDTNHAASVSELLGSHGAISTVGASCASGNLGLRAAMDELADGAAVVVLVAPVYDYAPTTLQALGLMGATTEATIPEATAASRPFGAARDGFVPSHGAAAMVLENLSSATARGARPLAELLGVAAGSDACHRPPRPSPPEQAALISDLLAGCAVAPRDLDLVSAHAASTPVGDAAEAAALRLALGPAVAEVPVNAAKAMLGHTGWSAALIEAVLAVAQMQAGAVHGTANLGNPDPRLGLRFAVPGPASVRTVLNNAFGFGGLNCVSLLRRMP